MCNLLHFIAIFKMFSFRTRLKYHTVVYTILHILLQHCVMGYLVSNSSCGVNYPYGKCYADYKVLRLFAKDADAIKLIDQKILRNFDLDIWSNPSSYTNATEMYFDVMVAPKDQSRIHSVLKSNMINASILHHDVKDLLIKEANMASTQNVFCIQFFIHVNMTLI